MPPRSDVATPTSTAPTWRSTGAVRRNLWIGLDQASIMGVELMGAILTWAAIGWLVDRWLGTGPWLLIVGALIGNAAGLYLIWLRSERMQQREQQAVTAAEEVRGGR